MQYPITHWQHTFPNVFERHLLHGSHSAHIYIYYTRIYIFVDQTGSEHTKTVRRKTTPASHTNHHIFSKLDSDCLFCDCQWIQSGIHVLICVPPHVTHLWSFAIPLISYIQAPRHSSKQFSCIQFQCRWWIRIGISDWTGIVDRSNRKWKEECL